MSDMDERQLPKVVKRFCDACWETQPHDANEFEQEVGHDRKAVIRPEGETCEFCPKEATKKALQEVTPEADPEPSAEQPVEPEPPSKPPARPSKKPKAA